MSIKVMSWVFENSEATLGSRLVLLALADYAHDDGSKAFPSVETLMKHTRMGRRGVQEALRKLEREGHVLHVGMTEFGTKIYQVKLEQGGADTAPPTEGEGGAADDAEGAQLTTEGGAADDESTSRTAPNPLRTHQGPVSRLPNGRANGTLPRFNGSVVNGDLWALTAQVLEQFNAQTGGKKRLLTSAGEASDAAKRIYGRVKSYPDLTLEEHTDIIRRTIESRWWRSGPATIGVIFGPGVFEENITRPGAAGAPVTDHQQQVADAIARGPELDAAGVQEQLAKVGLA
jgi:hypothetical protein